MSAEWSLWLLPLLAGAGLFALGYVAGKVHAAAQLAAAARSSLERTWDAGEAAGRRAEREGR